MLNKDRKDNLLQHAIKITTAFAGSDCVQTPSQIPELLKDTYEQLKELWVDVKETA